jgi:hypothetical protein
MRRLAVVFLLQGCTFCFNPDRLPCASTEPLPEVGPLSGVVGDGRAITWEWPPAVTDAGSFLGYRLCWGPSSEATPHCVQLRKESCEADACRLRLDPADAGLAYDQRVHARLLAEDGCGNRTDGGATTSVTPINGSFSSLEGTSTNSQCPTYSVVVDAGRLTIEQTAGLGLCVTTVVMGDELWDDATLDVAVRTEGNGLGGLLFRNPQPGGPRQAAVITNAAGLGPQLWLSKRSAATADVDVPVATAIPRIDVGVFHPLRVSTAGPDVSVSVGRDTSPLVEELRWHDPSDAGTRGRIGLVLATTFFQTGRVEFRELRARSGATIPSGGLTSRTWRFNTGSSAIDGVRLINANNSNVVACPATVTAPTSCPTCKPATDSRCLQLPGFGGSATIAAPLGIDFGKPWRFKFTFAADPADNSMNGQLLRTSVGDWGTRVILSANGPTYMNNLLAFGMSDLGAPLVRNQWNVFELTFNSATSYSVKWNNQDVATGVSFPVGVDPHLPALVLGGNLNGWFTDLEISQP